MNIKDKIQQDLDKLHVSKEIEQLRKALKSLLEAHIDTLQFAWSKL